MKNFIVAALWSVLSSAGFAWDLQPDASTVNFVSVKKDSIGEVHRFKQLQGNLDNKGAATLTISLASADTGVEIRDQRLREMLFEVAQFPTATFQTTIDTNIISALKAGQQAVVAVKGELALHGKSAPVATDVVVTKLLDGRLSVISQKPLIVNAEIFDLGAGVAKLAEAVSFPAISTAVPVTFALMFTPEKVAPGKISPPAPGGLKVQ